MVSLSNHEVERVEGLGATTSWFDILSPPKGHHEVY